MEGTIVNPNCAFFTDALYADLPKVGDALRRFGKDMASAMKSLGSLPGEHDPVKTIEDFVCKGTRLLYGPRGVFLPRFLMFLLCNLRFGQCVLYRSSLTETQR